MSNPIEETQSIDRLARLVLTSSDAEFLGRQLHDIMGYTELADAVENSSVRRGDSPARQQPWTPDALAAMQLYPPQALRPVRKVL